MTTKTKGRDRFSVATKKTSDSRNHTGQELLVGWFSLAKSSRINRQQKRGWQRGRK